MYKFWDVRSLAFASMCSVFCLSEVQEMEQHTPHTCMVHFDDPNKLHQFTLTITPDTGYWCGGKFVFSIEVLEDYNILVSVFCGILRASWSISWLISSSEGFMQDQIIACHTCFGGRVDVNC